MGNEKTAFISETFKGIYSGDSCVFEKTDDISAVKKIILSDSILDMKVLNIPTVANNILPDMIFNSIKRLSATQPLKEDVDYRIIGRDNDKYEILVFIKHNVPENALIKKSAFTVYHILENLLENGNFADDVSFIVREENASFVYNFRDRVFKKRSIYFDNDIDSLRDKSIYNICLYDKEHHDAGGFVKVKDGDIDRAINGLRKKIFDPDKNRRNRLLFLGFAIFAVLSIAFIEYLFISQNVKISEMRTEIEKNEKMLKNLKTNKGVSENVYKKYVELRTKKSHANTLFNLIYTYGKNNMEIQTVSLDGLKFSASGYCESDSKLENSFRGTGYFKDLNFYFTRKNGRINFRIDGKINYED